MIELVAKGDKHLRVPLVHTARGALQRTVRSLLAILVLSLAICALAQGSAVELEARVFDIASQLRCPVCTSESVAGSSSPTSLEMRQIIQEQLQAGRSESQVLTYFQERYGDWILLEPPKRGLHLLVWLLPGVAAVIGLLALVYFVRRWTQASREPVDVDDDDLHRVRDALAQRK